MPRWMSRRSPQRALVHHEPRAFQRVAGIQRAAFVVVNHAAVRRDALQQRTVLGLEEVALNLGDAAVNPLRAGASAHRHVAEVGA